MSVKRKVTVPAGSPTPRSESLLHRSAQLREDVGHLERRPYRFAGAVDPRLALLDRLHGEHAERDGDAGLDAGELEARRGLARDVVEVRRLAAHDRAERHDARVAPRLRERHRRERQLERARHGDDGDPLRRHAGLLERLERAREHAVRQPAVEARDDDRDRAPVAARVPFDHRVAGGHVDLALDVLDADALLGRVLDHLRGLRLGPGGEGILGGGRRHLVARRCFALLVAHSLSQSPFRKSWWCSLCPSLSRFAARYRRFSSFGVTSIATCSTTVSPKPSMPISFFGLFVRMRMVDRPRSARIWLPMPHSRASAGKPSLTFASTVSSPCSCSSYAASLLSRPMPRPSWLM